MKKVCKINENECVGCNLCVKACPVKCLVIGMGEKTHISMMSDAEKCIGCGLCAKICPINAITVE